jgi:hypothetical protein
MKVLLILIILLNNTLAYGQKNDYWLSYMDTSSGEELYGYKKMDGTIAIKAKYKIQGTDTFYIIAFVFDQGWKGIDRDEKTILIPFIYDNGPDYAEEGLFRFVENNKIGFADLNGKKVVPAQYDFATPFSEGLAGYTQGGHLEYEKGGEHSWWTGGNEHGYINKAGMEFKRITPLKNKQREAWTKAGKHLLLNNKGQIIKAG